MAEVRARPGEGIESLLKRFKKAVENSGILTDYRKGEYYEKPSVKRKRKQAAAIKRARKAEKTRKPKISKASWQWNKDRTKKIPTKRRPGTFNKSAGTNSNTNQQQQRRPSGQRTNSKPNYNNNRPYNKRNKDR